MSIFISIVIGLIIASFVLLVLYTTRSNKPTITYNWPVLQAARFASSISVTATLHTEQNVTRETVYKAVDEVLFTDKVVDKNATWPQIVKALSNKIGYEAQVSVGVARSDGKVPVIDIYTN